MKSFIGSHYIEKHSVGSSEKYTAYQIVDYVGRDHILVEEEGWATASTDFEPTEKCVVINLDNETTHKTSIITISKFIKDHQDDVIFFYFYENEVNKKLTDLSKQLLCCLPNEDYDEWIKALTRELCEK
jgi:hypothetical protein